MSCSFPTPQKGVSLLVSFKLTAKTILIVGANKLAASRAFTALEADSDVIIASRGCLETACDEIRWRVEQGQLSYVDLTHPGPQSDWLSRFQSLLQSLNNVALVCVTDTLLSSAPGLADSQIDAKAIYDICKASHTPVNVTDMPGLCDFTFPATHRFLHSKNKSATSLQVAVSTNGRGCRLAARIKREIVARLPREVADATEAVGGLRDHAKHSATSPITRFPANEEDSGSTPNTPVPPTATAESSAEIIQRRMRWISQVSEYWTFAKLAVATPVDIDEDLDPKVGLSPMSVHEVSNSRHDLHIPDKPRRGKIYLIGSGPGHPSLLTTAAHRVLTQHATLVLSDKLVPAPVLELIPPNVEVRIAKKYPGNSEAAQDELMRDAVDAANQGEIVVRLKQGDPMVYGRAGEEILNFRKHGYEPLVLPGVSSALAGPCLAMVPVTQRGVAESFSVCTGVGRLGKDVKLPPYERSRTVMILMGVARINQVLTTLQRPGDDSAPYPPYMPIALIERASMPDQRIIYSTIADMEAALQSSGAQRPPGMLVIGWAVLSLWGEGNIKILDSPATESLDELCVRQWLGGERWYIRDGLPDGWADFETTAINYGHE